MSDKPYFSNNTEDLRHILYFTKDNLVPCHNDLMAQHILKNIAKYILGFDYSGNNDHGFELSNPSVGMEYDINKLIS